MIPSKYYAQLTNTILSKAETVRGQFIELKKELEAAKKKIEQLESKLAQTSEERDLLLSTLNKLLSNEESDFTNTDQITIDCDEKPKIRSSGSDAESNIIDTDFKYDDKVFIDSSFSEALTDSVRNNDELLSCSESDKSSTFCSSSTPEQRIDSDADECTKIIPSVLQLSLEKNTHHKQAVTVAQLEISKVKDERNFPEVPERSSALLKQAIAVEDKIPDVKVKDEINSPETLEPVSVPEGEVKIESNDDHDAVNRNVTCASTKKKKHLNCSKSKASNGNPTKKSVKQRTFEKRCLICRNNNGLDKPYRSIQLLDQHIKKNHSDYSSAYIRCPYLDGKCFRHFQKLETLILHVTFRHQKESSRTPLRHFFPDLKNLWECSVCDKSFSKPRILAKHIRRMHGTAKAVVKCAARGYISRTIRQIMSLENVEKTQIKKSDPTSAPACVVKKEPNTDQVNDSESVSDSDASNYGSKAQTADLSDNGDENSSQSDTTESIHWCSLTDEVNPCKNDSFEIKVDVKKTRKNSPRLRRTSTRLRDSKTKIGNVDTITKKIKTKQNQEKSNRRASFDEKEINGAKFDYKGVVLKALKNSQRVKLRSASLPYDLRRWVIGNVRID